ncbi:MAG: phosphoribosylformylglycinamidine synthase subunit PurL [Caldilineaceae bacterium SB0661_bin_32]|uniref:Phosphoribosylformylglycinamidine synthase subunit PurL n=1 Tax=Caldilineaceae bacterium SB0661_bin_32 TaxID=2605255 RepID=A0A6B1D6M1_9CHLR|nr:phosphoribosylformylglycinamidine synthase subunit PurL [Caldilineaceae bacterium SB0661_bin_32]
MEVTKQSEEGDPRIAAAAHRLGISSLRSCNKTQLFFLTCRAAAAPSPDQINRLCDFLLVDPVTESAQVISPPRPCSDDSRIQPSNASNEHVVEVALRPGVTDVAARVLERGAAELGIHDLEAATATRYRLTGDLSRTDLHRLARDLLCNDTIERYSLGAIEPLFGHGSDARDYVEQVSLAGLNEEELLACSRERLLSLDAEEMKEIQGFYDEIGRAPTDVELETLAQTWSEHCVHKTFKSNIAFTLRSAGGQALSVGEIQGLLRSYIQAATEKVNRSWVRSAFVDDAGIIEFDDQYDLAFKVETHNHPSALEPFGGANTGIGGVVRDIIAVSARPVACTDVLCFGPQELPPEELPAGILHPARVQEGVVAGIGDYGNKLGLPTVNGAVIYDDGYLGNPLVFCGAVGLLPKGSHPTEPRQGDRIVVLGGRTGRDGIHGATFSSAELTQETHTKSGSAVQIGDPITEKGLIELVEAARDGRLYNAITDCGAGGLSSAVGEMGEKLGADIELQDVPLKYPGLTPWEIWLSEAQERMVLAVPPANLSRLQDLADLWEVEMRDLGRFSGDGWLRVRYGGRAVAEMPMSFLHDGLPIPSRTAFYEEPAPDHSSLQTVLARARPKLKEKALLLQMLSHPTVASKERIVRTYDHEVRGGTLVRPFVGPHMDGPADAAVLKPVGTWGHGRAFALSAGINPLLGKRDCYAMAVSAVDEAFRNAVSVGADPDQIALLDNFCWGNPTFPDRLGALVRTCQGCYDAAVRYNAPYISGKDSLYNEFEGQPIPGTLLISAIGIVPDMRRTCTSHLKRPGNFIFLLGETREELGGSLLGQLLGWNGGDPPSLPEEPLKRYRAVHAAMQAGLIQSCHDLSEGGLAVALAEMCLGGRLGAAVDIAAAIGSSFSHPYIPLFSETNGRLLLEVAPPDRAALEEVLSDLPIALIGEVTESEQLAWARNRQPIFNISIEEIVSAWKGAEAE